MYQTRSASVCVCLLVLIGTTAFGAQVAPADDSKPADYSKEAFVYESVLSKLVIENDGTYSIDTIARARVQSQAGVQQLGLLNFPYASATSAMDILYVRVVKADKRVVQTPLENVLDMPTEITQQAPFYSDQKQKQVAVKGLEIGDVLEYEYRSVLKTALDPGQFWFAFNFFQQGICLSEELQVSVPRDRYVKVESPKVQPTTADQGAYRVYTWKTASLETVAEKKKKAEAADPDEPVRPAVQITSFRGWDELGQWFRTLVAPRAVVTPQIQAKADEITRNAKTDQEKIQAIYDYVSTKFRYIGIALGIGRYQPHAADDVLSNDYGDCKDKHTLFAALLAAENIKAFPALVSTGTKIDPEMPSPLQFDHMITAIPQGPGFLFLDTTPEVAPFRYLVANIRDKDSLVVPDTGASKLVRTPKDPPFKSTFDFKTDGKLDDAGTLDTKSQIILRTDLEVLYRDAFRRSGQPQWNEVMQQISTLLGFAGTVSDVTISSPDATATPFQLNYAYNRKTYGDWDNRQIVSPFPFVFLPPVPEEPEKKSKPIKLGAPTEYVFHGTMILPPNSDPALRSTVDLHEEFAEYHSSYTETKGVLTFERRLVTKTDEISPAQINAYEKFVKTVNDDQQRFIPLQSNKIIVTGPSDGFIDLDALNAFREGTDALRDQDSESAVRAFRRAVEKDPHYSEAWYWLGVAQLQAGQLNPGLESMRKAIAINPKEPRNYAGLADILRRVHRDKEVLDVLRELNKIDPGNADAAQALATELEKQDRYTEAIAVLEPALKKNPENPRLQLALGKAYLHAGNKEEGIPMVRSAASNAVTKDDAASILADNGVDLQNALASAAKVVADVETESMAIHMDDLHTSDPQTVVRLAASWAALGAIKFRMGQFESAEKYLRAAWSLTQDPETADRLGQVYEKLGEKHEAALFYARALASGSAPGETRKRLVALRGQAKAQPGDSEDQLSLQELRTVQFDKFPEKPAKHAHAEFFLLFGSVSKAMEVRFVSGSEELRLAGAKLNFGKVEALFPDENPAKILRRGILDCEPELPGCVFVLYPPANVGISE